jgi:hypothetical protein
MKRLVDQPGPHAPLGAEAVRILLAAEATHRPPPGAKARVRVALLRRAPRRQSPWLRASVLVTIAFASALASATTMARRWAAHHADAPSSPPAVVAPAHKSPTRPVVTAAPGPVDSAPAVESAAIPTPTVVAEPSTPRLVARSRPIAHDAVSAPPSTRPAPAGPEETAQLVLDAVAALRREHDPRRAQALLDEYLRRSPDGPNAEEALALSIQASTALHDDRTRALAARYLASYPQGRFREAAERAASRFGP